MNKISGLEWGTQKMEGKNDKQSDKWNIRLEFSECMNAHTRNKNDCISCASHKFHEIFFYFILWSLWTNSSKAVQLECIYFRILNDWTFPCRNHLFDLFWRQSVCCAHFYVYFSLLLLLLLESLKPAFPSHWSIMSMFFIRNTRWWLLFLMLLSGFHVTPCAFRPLYRIVVVIMNAVWQKLLKSHFYPSKCTDFTQVHIACYENKWCAEFYTYRYRWYALTCIQRNIDEAKKNLFTFVDFQFTSNVT